MIKQLYLTHSLDPNRYNQVFLRVIAMTGYYIFPEAPELEPHHQIV